MNYECRSSGVQTDAFFLKEFRSSGGLTPDPSPKGEGSSINPSSQSSHRSSNFRSLGVQEFRQMLDMQIFFATDLGI